MIPARLGSKRIKKKNLRLIDRLPLIQYIINAAKSYATLGEIVDSMKVVFGEWKETAVV